jgi:hypothetical protein
LSIPLHKDARRVYEKHGMIQRLPQDPWQEDLEKLWLSVITTLAGGVAGFILRGRQLFSRSERRKRWQEDQAHRVYADAHANVDTGLKGLAELREQIQNDFAARHLTALQVVALDTLVLDYLAKLRKRRTLLRPWVAPSLSRESRSTTPTTGSQGHQP